MIAYWRSVVQIVNRGKDIGFMILGDGFEE
jgi:hypothetical protein